MKEPSSLFGFLRQPPFAQFTLLIAMIIGFGFSVETEQYFAAAVIGALMAYYFYARRRFLRHRRHSEGLSINQGSFQRRRKASQDVKDTAPDA